MTPFIETQDCLIYLPHVSCVFTPRNPVVRDKLTKAPWFFTVSFGSSFQRVGGFQTEADMISAAEDFKAKWREWVESIAY